MLLPGRSPGVPAPQPSSGDGPQVSPPLASPVIGSGPMSAAWRPLSGPPASRKEVNFMSARLPSRRSVPCKLFQLPPLAPGPPLALRLSHLGHRRPRSARDAGGRRPPRAPRPGAPQEHHYTAQGPAGSAGVVSAGAAARSPWAPRLARRRPPPTARLPPPRWAGWRRVCPLSTSRLCTLQREAVFLPPTKKKKKKETENERRRASEAPSAPQISRAARCPAASPLADAPAGLSDSGPPGSEVGRRR